METDFFSKIKFLDVQCEKSEIPLPNLFFQTVLEFEMLYWKVKNFGLKKHYIDYEWVGF